MEVKVGTPCTLSCTVSGITSSVTMIWRGFTPGQAVEIDVDLSGGSQTKELRLLENENHAVKFLSTRKSYISNHPLLAELTK